MNSVFQRSGEVQVGLTYITGTVVKAGQRLVDAFFGGPRWVWLRYITLWAGLTVGAVLGAATYHRIGLDALWVGLVLLVVSTVSTWVVRRVSSPSQILTRSVRAQRGRHPRRPPSATREPGATAPEADRTSTPRWWRPVRRRRPRCRYRPRLPAAARNRRRRRLSGVFALPAALPGCRRRARCAGV